MLQQISRVWVSWKSRFNFDGQNQQQFQDAWIKTFRELFWLWLLIKIKRWWGLSNIPLCIFGPFRHSFCLGPSNPWKTFIKKWKQGSRQTISQEDIRRPAGQPSAIFGVNNNERRGVQEIVSREISLCCQILLPVWGEKWIMEGTCVLIQQ